MSTHIAPLPSTQEPDAAAARCARRIQSQQLLQGSRRVVIDHGKASYTLLLTRNDKLILVK
jgi:hemin uptake protein HemP